MIGLSLEGKHRFKIEARGHEITVDVPPEKGGEDQGMMPTELFAASLAACVGITTTFWLEKHRLSAAGLKVYAQPSYSTNPRRVAGISVELKLPQPLSPEQKEGLWKMIQHCPVMLSLSQPPKIKITLASA